MDKKLGRTTIKPQPNGDASKRKYGNVNLRRQTCDGWAHGLASRRKFDASLSCKKQQQFGRARAPVHPRPQYGKANLHRQTCDGWPHELASRRRLDASCKKIIIIKATTTTTIRWAMHAHRYWGKQYWDQVASTCVWWPNSEKIAFTRVQIWTGSNWAQVIAAITSTRKGRLAEHIEQYNKEVLLVITKLNHLTWLLSPFQGQLLVWHLQLNKDNLRRTTSWSHMSLMATMTTMWLSVATVKSKKPNRPTFGCVGSLWYVYYHKLS